MTGTPPDRRTWRLHGTPLVSGAPDGPLHGETVAVKDIFEIAGYTVGAGVPGYLDESPVATRHSPAVERLLAAGADLAGIAQTDQFAYSLAGSNEHYGTPVNAAVPGSLPGGSSSGSATAVALGEATIGLGTDTAGSTRVPASYQGLWGLRTTHGSIPMAGVVPLAQSFDTVGLLTRSGEILLRAAQALLPSGTARLSGQATTAPALLEVCAAPVVAAFEHLAMMSAQHVDLPEPAPMAEAFRVCQGFEAWRVHGDWLRTHPGAVVGAPAARFHTAATIDPAEYDAARVLLRGYRIALDDALGAGVLIMPTAASAAPSVTAPADAVDAARAATLQLTCLAGITGRPAVSVPLLDTVDGPVGVCLVGPRGSDLELITLARQFADAQPERSGRPSPGGYPAEPA